MAGQVDLNADLGELPGTAGADLDAQLLSVVTSANVACGGHAGDRESMRRVGAIAASAGVALGAHVSYPDRAGFGRRAMLGAPGELLDNLRAQLDELDMAVTPTGARVRYLKAHGALYNASVVSETAAAVLVELAGERRLPVLTQHDSVLAARAATAGVQVFAEFFADRSYESDGRLRARSRPGALITQHSAVLRRTLSAIRDARVTSHDGVHLRIRVDSVCVHGDTPGAVDLARGLREALEQTGQIEIRSFLGPPR